MLFLRATFPIKSVLKQGSIAYTFAKKKKEKQDPVDKVDKNDPKIITEVNIQQKLQTKSAALYDYYVKSRDRPVLTLDNYCIRYVYVIERQPIYLPYHQKKFQYYRQKYNFIKRSGLVRDIPKQLQVNEGDYLFNEYERVNPQNQISHRHTISRTQVYEYPENSRYWRYVDPTIKDPHSIQTYSSDNVYFIVKNHQGKWMFPTRQLTERDNHKQIFTLMNNQLFAVTPSPYVYVASPKPVFTRKVQDTTVQRGQGYYDCYFKGLSINGIPQFPTKNYADYAWVPKPHISKYFDDQYFEQNIKLAVHVC